jgi:hypothetical protein
MEETKHKGLRRIGEKNKKKKKKSFAFFSNSCTDCDTY